MHEDSVGQGGKLLQCCTNHDSGKDATRSDQTTQRNGSRAGVVYKPASKFYLSMSGLLNRNILVSTANVSLQESRTWAKCVGVVKQDVTKAIQYYQSLLTKCREQDPHVDRSDFLSHRKAREFKEFCQDCASLVFLRGVLFKIPYDMVECKNEEEVKHKEATLRAAEQSAAQLSPLKIRKLVKQDGWYQLPMGCLLKYNSYVHCEPKQLLQHYRTALRECQNDREAATTKFTSLHTICVQLDASTAPVTAEFDAHKHWWQSFCAQSVQLCLLRHALYHIYKYDPCQAMIEALEQSYRTPAPRRVLRRFQLTSPTAVVRSSMGHSSRTRGLPTTKDDIAMDGIKTIAYGGNSFICKIRCQRIYMVSIRLSSEQHISSDTMLVLHVNGLVESNFVLTIKAADLLLAFEDAQRVDLTGAHYTRARDDIMAVNTDQLASLVQLGVREASTKLCKFKKDLLRFLWIKQLKHNIPVIAHLHTSADVCMATADTDDVLDRSTLQSLFNSRMAATADVDDDANTRVAPKPLIPRTSPANPDSDAGKQRQLNNKMTVPMTSAPRSILADKQPEQQSVDLMQVLNVAGCVLFVLVLFTYVLFFPIMT